MMWFPQVLLASHQDTLQSEDLAAIVRPQPGMDTSFATNPSASNPAGDSVVLPSTAPVSISHQPHPPTGHPIPGPFLFPSFPPYGYSMPFPPVPPGIPGTSMTNGYPGGQMPPPIYYPMIGYYLPPGWYLFPPGYGQRPPSVFPFNDQSSVVLIFQILTFHYHCRARTSLALIRLNTSPNF